MPTASTRALPGRHQQHERILGLLFHFRALQIGEASKLEQVGRFSLVLVALFAVAFLGERPSLREWAGIAWVAAGVLVLSLK